MKPKKRKGRIFASCLILIFLFRPVVVHLMLLGSFFIPDSYDFDEANKAAQLEIDALKTELVHLKEIMNLSLNQHGCTYARVIYSGGGFVVIESDQKLEQHQTVSSSSGFVGKIAEVLGNRAAVETLRSTELSYDLSVVLVKENLRLEAMITSYDHGYAKAILFNDEIRPSEQMIALISDYSFSPSGISVGMVKEVMDEFSGPAVLIELYSTAVPGDVVCVFEN